MSYQTKINGFTVWANHRLQLMGHEPMDNILGDFMKGYNLKLLAESLTGRPLHKMKTFDGLRDGQKETRIQWLIDECRTCGVIDERRKLDSRLISLKSFEHVMDFFWSLVSFDLEFMRKRSEYMRQRNVEKLIKYPFSCIPPPWSSSKSRTNDESGINGGAGDIIMNSKIAALQRDAGMISNNKPTKGKWTPEESILYLINKHLKMSRDGKKLNDIVNLSDVLNVDVFCALVNSIVPDTFISDVLLNDRWTMTLLLQTINAILRLSSQFQLDDLMEGDGKSLCCYFTGFFMAGYTLRQTKAVVDRVNFLSYSLLRLQEQISEQMSTSPSIQIQKAQDISKKYEKEMNEIYGNFDVEASRKWMSNVTSVQNQAWEMISNAMKKKYEMIIMPANVMVKEIKRELFINLEMSGYGFYQLTAKESVTNERNIIIQHKVSNVYYDNRKIKEGKKQRTSRNVLGISSANTQELSPEKFPDYHIFLEALSANKSVRAGTLFLYQIFPDDMNHALSYLLKSIKNGELDKVKNLVSFFQSDPSFINGTQGHSKTTALHLASRLGNFNIVLYLLEENANVNVQNSFGSTPLHVAVENGTSESHKNICKLLIEWGADVDIVNKNKLKPLDDPKNADLCQSLRHLYDYWNNISIKLASGNEAAMTEVVQMAEDSPYRLSTLRSRCVDGSTVMHAASRHARNNIITQLIIQGIDINVRDDRQAIALHEARSVDTVKFLIKHGSDVTVKDHNGNTALHCLLEQFLTDDEIDSECINVLVGEGIGLDVQNDQGYSPLHSAAVSGSIRAVDTLLELDYSSSLLDTLNNETGDVPNVVYLALKHDHLPCARHLLDRGFMLTATGGEDLILQILKGTVRCSDVTSTLGFLLENGKDVKSIVYPGGDTCLHLASTSIALLSCLQLFINFHCDVNAKNDDSWSPLHSATSSGNCQAAAVLIENGAEITCSNSEGLSPFDYIEDYEQWISSGLFDEVTVQSLRAFGFKKSRDMIRFITDKLKKAEISESADRRKK